MKNKIIIYDDSCPMCKWYTSEFVNHGMIDADNRVGFTQASTEILQNIDIERSRHEIPLYDTETKETLYGPNALYYLLGEKMRIFKPLFKNSLFTAVIWQIYKIITYNRRIIAGSASPKTGFDCAPSFNLFYRCLYIFIALTSAILIAKQVVQYTLAYDNIWLNAFLVGITFIIGISIMIGLFLPKRVSYWGHIATLLLADNLLAGLILAIISLVGIIPLALWAGVLMALCLFIAFMTWKRKDALQEVF